MNTWIAKRIPNFYPPGSDAQMQTRITLALIASLSTGLMICFYAILIISFGETLAGGI